MVRVRKLRDLTLEESAHGRPYVTAASGLIRAGKHLCVVADDDRDLALFPDAEDAPGRLVPLLPDDLPRAEGEPAAGKPDFEALATALPFAGAPYGALLALESGSKRDRHWAVVWPLGSDGSPSGRPRAVDMSPLYSALSAEIASLNVEGAAWRGDQLCLLQRGNGPGARDAIVELSGRGIAEALAAARPPSPDVVEAVSFYDLGEAEGVRLCFSDAHALPDGRLVFAAAAEDAEHGDGALTGAVVGVISRSGVLEAREALEPRAKAEGVLAWPEGGRAIGILLVADADDPGRPSPLLAGQLES